MADAAYSKQVVDLSPFANGASHLLSFSYANGAAGVNNMLLDDVGLSPGSAPHTAMPTVTATAPASPSTSTTPKVKGTAEAGSSVRSTPTARARARRWGPGPRPSSRLRGSPRPCRRLSATTTIYAKAAKTGQNDSPCSTTFAAYAHRGPPETTLVKTPKKRSPRGSGSARLPSHSPRRPPARPSSAASTARRSRRAPRDTSSSSRSVGTPSRCGPSPGGLTDPPRPPTASGSSASTDLPGRSAPWLKPPA